MQIQPYLFFEGRCDEAAEFYRTAVGAEVLMRMTYNDAPESAGDASSDDATCQPGDGDKVMHMSLRIGDSFVSASDGRCSGEPDFKGISLTLMASDPAEAERLFNALSDGGQIQMPLGPTFFSPSFGMLVDRFGVSWMVYVVPEEAASMNAPQSATSKS